MFIRISFLALACALCACGSDYKYQYSFNGCDTGEHKADSKEEHCQNLKNESLNKGCAQSIRKEEYIKQGCGAW